MLPRISDCAHLLLPSILLLFQGSVSSSSNIRPRCSGFRCDNGECIPERYRCDAYEHCWDGTDEQRCESWSSGCGGFLCQDGNCISYDYRCDSNIDCYDESDEIQCHDNNGRYRGSSRVVSPKDVSYAYAIFALVPASFIFLFIYKRLRLVCAHSQSATGRSHHSMHVYDDQAEGRHTAISDQPGVIISRGIETPHNEGSQVHDTDPPAYELASLYPTATRSNKGLLDEEKPPLYKFPNENTCHSEK